MSVQSNCRSGSLSYPCGYNASVPGAAQCSHQARRAACSGEHRAMTGAHRLAGARGERRGLGVDLANGAGIGTAVSTNRIKPPFAGNALQYVCPTLRELEARAEHQLAHGARYQHLRRARESPDPRSDVNRNAGEILTTQLALASVNAGAQLDPQRPDLGADRPCTPNRLCGTLEGGEEAVTERLYHPPPVALELCPRDVVMALHQRPPALVPELRGALGRGDDVGEEDRRERAVGIGPVAGAGEELLDLVDDRLPGPKPDEVVVTRENGELRPVDLLGEVAAQLDWDGKVTLPVHDQGRRRDSRQCLAGVHQSGSA